MTQDKEHKKPKKKIVLGRKMSGRDIVQAVTDPDSVDIVEKGFKKKIVIPTASSIEADVEKIIRSERIAPNSSIPLIVKLFSDKRNPDEMTIKSFINRIRNMNDEQLKVVEVICSNGGFSAKDIFTNIQSIKKFDGAPLLSLRAFIDLNGIGPGPLYQFFITTLPQSKREEVGKEAYEQEVKQKIMSHNQYNVFYNICYQIQGIEPTDALSMLRKIRNLKPQHAIIINTFLKEGVVFGNKPISNINIAKLINLLLVLPEMSSRIKFNQMIKRISTKPKQKNDFGYIISSYRNELLKERSKKGGFLS